MLHAPVDTEGPDRVAVKRLFVYTAFTFVMEKERKQGENGYRINYIRVWN